MYKLGLGYKIGALGSKLKYFRWLSDYKTRVETDSGAVQDDNFTRSVYKILSDYSLKDNMKLLITAEGGLKTRISGVERYVTKAYDLSDNDNDPAQTTEADQPFLGGRIASNEIQNFKSVTGVTKTLAHTDITVSGTYTLIKVLNAEDSGKTVVSFTEVSSGTYNSISWTGRLYAYAIYGGTISGANQALIETDLLNLVAEVESVTIGTQEWGTSNLEIVATPMGNVMAEMQTASAVEKMTNGGFDTADNWILSSDWNIAGGTLNNNGNINGYAYQNIGAKKSTWYKVTYTLTGYTAGDIRCMFNGSTNSYGTSRNSNGTFIEYLKTNETANGNFTLNESGTTGFNGSIDNVSVKELGWADSQELYDGLIAQGYTEANALKECGWWCYYNNDPAIGAVYGKLYNWFAVELLQNDIDAYNAANPTTPWGWHVPTQTEFETLATALGGASVAGGKMKVAGTDYWNSPNTGADNTSGFSALGGGIRRNDGKFLSINSYFEMWLYSTTTNIRAFHDDGKIYLGAPNLIRGYSIRLIRE